MFSVTVPAWAGEGVARASGGAVRKRPQASYCIVRVFDASQSERVIRRGLTLAQARAHCRGPESDYRTARGEEEQWFTRVAGPWVDVYRPEVRPEPMTLPFPEPVEALDPGAVRSKGPLSWPADDLDADDRRARAPAPIPTRSQSPGLGVVS